MTFLSVQYRRYLYFVDDVLESNKVRLCCAAELVFSDGSLEPVQL